MEKNKATKGRIKNKGKDVMRERWQGEARMGLSEGWAWRAAAQAAVGVGGMVQGRVRGARPRTQGQGSR